MAKLVKKIIMSIFDDGSTESEEIPAKPVQSGSNLGPCKALEGLWT